MKKSFIYPLFATIILLSSCSTDLDVTGNYKETMVVYGLLDQSQPKQYIKINKAFLIEGNALQYAQEKNATQYENSLNVVLKRINIDGTELSSYNLIADNTIPKNSGIFYGPDQSNVIYSVATTLYSDSEYKLVIRNNETGAEVSSQTMLLNDATLTSPNPLSPSSTFKIIDPNNDNYNFAVRWNTGKNARVYNAIIRFNYIDSTLTGNISQTLDWVFPTKKTQYLTGGEAMSSDFLGQDLLQFIGNQLNDYPGLIARKPGKVSIVLIAGGDDLKTFIEVNAPSTGLIQEKPEFTNIKNGLGLFSARYFKPPFGKTMDGNSLDELACGQYTKDLKFLDRNGVICP